jgi:hypothetical protein
LSASVLEKEALSDLTVGAANCNRRLSSLAKKTLETFF